MHLVAGFHEVNLSEYLEMTIKLALRVQFRYELGAGRIVNLMYRYRHTFSDEVFYRHFLKFMFMAIFHPFY